MQIIYYILITGILWSFFGNYNDKKEISSTRNTRSYQQQNYQYNYSSEDLEISAPENPYDEGSGHYAGYEWAEENDVDDCDGNSQSFIEGCEEYVSQKEGYNNSQEE